MKKTNTPAQPKKCTPRKPSHKKSTTKIPSQKKSSPKKPSSEKSLANSQKQLYIVDDFYDDRPDSPLKYAELFSDVDTDSEDELYEPESESHDEENNMPSSTAGRKITKTKMKAFKSR